MPVDGAWRGAGREEGPRLRLQDSRTAGHRLRRGVAVYAAHHGLRDQLVAIVVGVKEVAGRSDDRGMTQRPARPGRAAVNETSVSGVSPTRGEGLDPRKSHRPSLPVGGYPGVRPSTSIRKGVPGGAWHAMNGEGMALDS